MERPKSIRVFGVLNIIFGAWGVLGGLCGIASQGMLATMRRDPNFRNPVLDQMDKVPWLRAWTMVSLGLGLIAAIVLIVAGVGLLQTKRWGRTLSVAYSIYGLCSTVVGAIIGAVYLWAPLLSQIEHAQGPEVAGAIGGIAGGVIGSCFGILYCALLLYFMTRPLVVAAFDPNFDLAKFMSPAATGSVPYAASPASVVPVTPYAPPTTSGFAASAAPSGTGDDAVATIIPYRNAPALIAYYLGVFSISACIPFLGIIGVGMAIAAFICGINGLKRAREHPEAHGRVHAWIGIIGGAICTILGLLINVIVIIAVVAGNLR